jgi:hypothetical protein
MKRANGVSRQDYRVIIRAGRIEGLEAIDNTVYASSEELQERVGKQAAGGNWHRRRGEDGPEYKVRLHANLCLRWANGQLRDYRTILDIFLAQDQIEDPAVLLRMLNAMGIVTGGGGTNGQLPVLVSVIEFTDKPQRMHQRLIVVKRLQEANDCCSPRPNPSNLIDTSRVKATLALLEPENGELSHCVSVVRAAEVGGESPSQMIERGPEIMGTVSNQGGESSSRRVLQDCDAVEVLAHLSVELIGNRIGVTVEEEPRLMVLEGLQVFPCSNYFETWAIERMHEVYSHHERRRTANTEDPKRSRNPDPQAQGRRRRHREAGEVEAVLNSASPEEVARQTSPRRRSGGYSATHTRLGSLEDA